MRPWIWLRLVAVLYAIFALGHTWGHITMRSRGSVEAAIFEGMRRFQFDAMGFRRSHWIYYNGFSLFLSVNLLLLVALTWQLSGLSRTQPRLVLPLVVSLFVATVLFAALGWLYFFPAPAVVATLAALGLGGALLALRQAGAAAGRP